MLGNLFIPCPGHRSRGLERRRPDFGNWELTGLVQEWLKKKKKTNSDVQAQK